MKLAPPMLPPGWEERSGRDGPTRVVALRGTQGCGPALLWTACFLCLLPLLSCGGFWANAVLAWLAATVLALIWVLPTLWLTAATEIWTLSASRFELRVALTWFLVHRQAWQSGVLRVAGRGEGCWEVRVEGDSENRRVLRTNDLEEALGLASFVAEKTGWAILYDELDTVAPRTLDYVLRLRSAARLRLLLESRTLLPYLAGAKGKHRREVLLRVLHESEAELPMLESALRDPDPAARVAALDLLVALGDRTALPAIRQLLVDREGEVRWGAVAALGQLRDEVAVPALCDLLRERSTLQSVAAVALGLIGAGEAGPALATLLRAGREIEDVAREEAALALGWIRYQAAVPDLCAVLSDPVVRIREAAARALGQIGDTQATPALCRALHDPDGHVAARAAGALGRIRDPAALTALQQAPRCRARTSGSR